MEGVRFFQIMKARSKDEAMKLWLHEMGDKEYSYDFAGKKIKRSDYLVDNQVGWVISYLKPLELGGKDNIGNIVIMHHRTFEEKGMQYPKMVIYDQEYIIHYSEKDDYYYIEKVLSDDEDDDGVFI
jgi:hypothetical protein